MPGNPLTDPNWAADLADTVERIVGNVRDKTTSNIVLAARAAVFGVILAIVGSFVAVLVGIGLLRGIQALLELAVDWPQAVYLSYFVVGGICCLAGALLMKKRHTTDA